jgi:molybdopterin-guanine dinucleotide biosynthesis protein A
MGRMYQDITGIILSGGKSTRMGENKSFLTFGTETVIEHIVNLMRSIFSEVVIITNEPEIYKFLNIKTYKDIFQNVGPIAGIHSGLVNSKTEKNFIISCDIPLMNADMIKSIIDQSSDSLVTAPKADGFIQQLCAVYNKSLIPTIEEIIQADTIDENRDSVQTKRKCKVHTLLDKIDAKIIENIEILDGYHENIFLNMNRPEDYAQIKSIISLK